jgi:hypothetical protein
MAGGERLIIVNTDIALPTSIAVDWRLQRIYWGDATQLKIWTSDYNGENRHMLAQGYRPRSMIVYKRWVYFSDTEASMSGLLA